MAAAGAGGRWKSRFRVADAAASAAAVAPADTPAGASTLPPTAPAPSSEEAAHSGVKRKAPESEPSANTSVPSAPKAIPPRFPGQVKDYSKPVGGFMTGAEQKKVWPSGVPKPAQPADDDPVPKGGEGWKAFVDWTKRSAETNAEEGSKDKDSANPETICWNFTRGFCKNGSWCNWVHPGHNTRASSTGGVAKMAFNEGSRVQIHGLAKKPELNDRVGEVVMYDPEKSRWQVRLGNGQRYFLKEENLQRC